MYHSKKQNNKQSQNQARPQTNTLQVKIHPSKAAALFQAAEASGRLSRNLKPLKLKVILLTTCLIFFFHLFYNKSQICKVLISRVISRVMRRCRCHFKYSTSKLNLSIPVSICSYFWSLPRCQIQFFPPGRFDWPCLSIRIHLILYVFLVLFHPIGPEGRFVASHSALRSECTQASPLWGDQCDLVEDIMALSAELLVEYPAEPEHTANTSQGSAVEGLQLFHISFDNFPIFIFMQKNTFHTSHRSKEQLWEIDAS